jgi:hypothetical protein
MAPSSSSVPHSAVTQSTSIISEPLAWLERSHERAKADKHSWDFGELLSPCSFASFLQAVVADGLRDGVVTVDVQLSGVVSQEG